MRLLLDTQILIWLVADTQKLSASSLESLRNLDNDLFFSSISIWEIAIKQRLARKDFKANAQQVQEALAVLGCEEVPMTSSHALVTLQLPQTHGDPFDRMLLAQAMHEGLTLVTADKKLVGYGGPILRW